jgi:hypothetical protein
MAELKRIDLQSGVFEANGKTYTIEQYLSIERYCEHQILEKELAYPMTFKKTWDKLMDIKNHLNKLRFVEASVALMDLLRGWQKIEEREPTVLKICALFCNTEDEDRTIFTKDLYTAKIQDWKKEGYAVNDFFWLASNMVAGLVECYKGLTPTTLGQTNNQVEAGPSTVREIRLVP